MQSQASSLVYVGLLDSPSEDEKIEMYLTEEEGGEVRIVLRAIARSGLGWYPQKTLAFHPGQLEQLEVLVKRARMLVRARDVEATSSSDAAVIQLTYLGCPAVAE